MEPLATRLAYSKETLNFWVFRSHVQGVAVPAIYVAKATLMAPPPTIVVTVVEG